MPVAALAAVFLSALLEATDHFMKRRRHPILLVFALLMFGLTLALWPGSYWRWATVYTETVYDGPPEYHYTRYLVIFEVNWGRASFCFFRDLPPRQGHWKLAHFARPGHQIREADAQVRFALYAFGCRHIVQGDGLHQYEVAWPMWFMALLTAVPSLLLIRSTIKWQRSNRSGFELCAARPVIQ